jgi:hypothetical protein
MAVDLLQITLGFMAGFLSALYAGRWGRRGRGLVAHFKSRSKP